MGALTFAAAWLFARLVLIFYDERLSNVPLCILAASQLALCFIVLTFNSGSIFIAVLSMVILFVHERLLPQKWLNETRLAGTAVVLITIALTQTHLTVSPWLQAVGATIPRELLSMWMHHGDSFLWFLVGFLLVANEANLVIRSLFRRFRLEPRLPTEKADSQQGELDQREYNAGRVIGILERWLMYSVIVTSQNYNVIAIIIAAKGIARFRELDRREFAEYVLIGTLASTLLTIVVGEAVIRLIE